MATEGTRTRVVVVGGGFGGVQAVKALRRADADVTLIDRNNYNLFQPLTYQVATGALAPGDIAMPLRHIFRRQPHVRVLMAEARSVDLERREVVVDQPGGLGSLTVPYDTLVVAGGSDYSYFGHDEWRSVALEVKTLDSALEVRGRIFHAFETAELNPDQRESWLTFVVVGAGPTGVEMVGQIAELARGTLPGEFRAIDPRSSRVLLVETGERVLSSFADPLPRKALRSLDELGVETMLGHTVVDIRSDAVDLESRAGGRSTVPTRTVVWAAGVTASRLGRMLGEASSAEVDRAGRLTVEPDLSLPGHPEVFVLGDMVRVRHPRTGEPATLPGLAPVAIQEGRYVGRLISARLAGHPARAPFRYLDKGMLATIGRARGVAQLRFLRFNGLLAWLAWLLVHIYFLIGFENREIVMMRWAYSYVTQGRGNRLITEAAALPSADGRLAEKAP